MENWRDYVGYQGINSDDFEDKTKPIKAFYLTAMEDGRNGFHVLRLPFMPDEVVLTDEEVGAKVEELLNELPQIEITEPDNSLATATLLRAKNNVATATKRGVASTNYNNTWFYKGSSQFDCPIIVCGIDDKYIVLKHPNFEKYGFNVV